jgi:rhodanese-related sulfurtransferase
VKRAHRFLVIALLAVLVLPGAAPAMDAAAAISVAELREQQDSGSPPVIVDVRTGAEFQRGHIPGAVHIPHDQLDARLSELFASPSDTIVVYCGSGRRAWNGKRTLLQNGFDRVLRLKGGILAWERAGNPIERSSNQ